MSLCLFFLLPCHLPPPHSPPLPLSLLLSVPSCKKYPLIELRGLFSYLVSRLINGEANELIVVQVGEARVEDAWTDGWVADRHTDRWVGGWIDDIRTMR